LLLFVEKEALPLMRRNHVRFVIRFLGNCRQGPFDGELRLRQIEICRLFGELAQAKEDTNRTRRNRFIGRNHGWNSRDATKLMRTHAYVCSRLCEIKGDLGTSLNMPWKVEIFLSRFNLPANAG
jgi:hypothetical protein